MQFKASSWMIRTLVWATALGMAWYFVGPVYARLLGSFVYRFLSEGTFLFLKSQVFSIGLGHPSAFGGPLLDLTAHNFGFGLVVTGAVVLGTPGVPGHCSAWLSLGYGSFSSWCRPGP